MSTELWIKYSCPICERLNWIQVEHWDEPEVQAICCWYCHETCWLDIFDNNYTYEKEMKLRDTIGVADARREVIANGYPRPRRNKAISKFLIQPAL